MSVNLNVLETSDEDLMEGGESAPEKVEEPAGAPVEPGQSAQGDDQARGGGEQPGAEDGAQETSQETPPAEPEAPKAGDPAPEAERPEDYAKLKEFYDRVMGPIKAAGKTIQLTSVDEVISLLQMGADYTRKTTEVSHYRKFGMMLEKAGLLDEAKLDLVISVTKGDKEALKKLLKDLKVDPVDIDTTGEDKYKPGAHVVPEEQAKLQEAINDLLSQEGGTETHDLIRDTWDVSSKQVLWKNPSVLQHIHQQRLSGVYAKITAEVERRKVLGTLPADMYFLEMYKAVGDEMYGPKPGTQGSPGARPTAVTKDPATAGGKAPVIRRPASSTTSSNRGNPAARAAAATRTTPKSMPTVPNIMALSDEELAKL